MKGGSGIGAVVVAAWLGCTPPNDPASNTDPAGTTTDASQDSGSTTAPTGDTATQSTGGGVTPAPSCADYLACLMDAEDPMLDQAAAMYGPQGSCWIDARSAAACVDACDEGFDACSLAEGDGTGSPPLACSLSTLAPGAVSPVVMGQAVGQLPIEIGTAIEGYCGCHLVRDNAQLVPLTPEYNGAIRFRTLAEFHAPFGGEPTYRKIEQRSITQQNMPPVYHCEASDFGSLPADVYEAMGAWLAAGAPDGASWP